MLALCTSAVKDGKEAMKRLKAEKDRRAKERQLEKLKEIEKDVSCAVESGCTALAGFGDKTFVLIPPPHLLHTGPHEIHDAWIQRGERGREDEEVPL